MIRSFLFAAALLALSVPATAEDAAFAPFERALDQLNARVESQAGFRLFTAAANPEPGGVLLTPSAQWLAAPPADQRGSLRTVLELWLAAGGGRPVMMIVDDGTGHPHTVMVDDGTGPRFRRP